MNNFEISNKHPDLKFTESALLQLLGALSLLENFFIPEGELSVVFLTEDAICGLHDSFLEDPSPTDVITFPGNSELDFAGEICISVDQAKKVHKEHQQSFAEELTLYLVHGWLHLAGYKDKSTEQKKQMRAAEQEVLGELKKKGVSVDFCL